MSDDTFSSSLNTTATFVLDHVGKYPDHQAQVYLYQNQNRSLSYQQGRMDQMGFEAQTQCVIKLYHDARMAMVSTADFSQASLTECLEKARTLVRFSDHDPDHGLPAHALKVQAKVMSDLGQYRPYAITHDKLIETCTAMEDAGLSVPGITQCEGVGFDHITGHTSQYDTSGFTHHHATTYHSWYASFIAGTEQNMVRESNYTANRDAQYLLCPITVARDAAQKTIAQQQPRTVAPQRCAVILDARLARTFFGEVLQALHGYNIYQNNSFLLECLGKQVCADAFSWLEVPHEVGAMGSCWFDAEGVATLPESPLIVQGVLQRYILNCYTAKKLGLTTTANAGGMHNLKIKCAQTMSFSDLLKASDSGVYITQWMGQGANISTGDFSKGAKGFWFERGQIQYPVHDMTIAGHMKDMLMGLSGMSNNIDKRGNIQCGDLWFDAMTVA